MMGDLLRPILLLAIVLAIPILPFLAFGDALEQQVRDWFTPPPSPPIMAAAVAGVLSTDIFLPVPSSVVSTLAGAHLGTLLATVASWLGMMAGTLCGFALARKWGTRLAVFFSKPEDLSRAERLSQRFGSLLIIISRPVPVLAEATVLLLGTVRLSWRRFLPSVALSNLGVALVYSSVGQFAWSYGQMPLALAASIALPLLGATIARKFLP